MQARHVGTWQRARGSLRPARRAVPRSPPLDRKRGKPASGRTQQQRPAAAREAAWPGCGGRGGRARTPARAQGHRPPPPPPRAPRPGCGGKFNFPRLRLSPRRVECALGGPPHPHHATWPTPPARVPPPGSCSPRSLEARWTERRAEPCQAQPRWRALKNGAQRPERRDIFFPLTELFPTSGCRTGYSSYSAALRDPPPHPVVSSPPSPSAASSAVPPPLRFKMAPSLLRRLLQSNCRGQHPGVGKARSGCPAPPSDQTSLNARAPSTTRARLPPRPCARARAR